MTATIRTMAAKGERREARGVDLVGGVKEHHVSLRQHHCGELVPLGLRWVAPWGRIGVR